MDIKTKNKIHLYLLLGYIVKVGSLIGGGIFGIWYFMVKPIDNAIRLYTATGKFGPIHIIKLVLEIGLLMPLFTSLICIFGYIIGDILCDKAKELKNKPEEEEIFYQQNHMEKKSNTKK